MSIIKREEDAQSIPVDHMWVTLDIRAAESPDRHVSFAQLCGSQLTPLPTTLLH